MNTLVPSHSPHMLASAGIRSLSGHVHGVGQSFHGHDDFGCNDLFGATANVLGHEERKAVAAPSDILDAAESGYERLLHSEHFQQFLLPAHVCLHAAPRELVPLGDQSSGSASASIYGYPSVAPLDLTKVNVGQQIVRIAA